MRRPNYPGSYTTGEAREITGVSQQSIIRTFDRGALKGFRPPGSKFRRIYHGSIVSMMNELGMIPKAEWRTVVILLPEGHSAGTKLAVVLEEEEKIATERCVVRSDVERVLERSFAALVVCSSAHLDHLGWPLEECVADVRAKSIRPMPWFLVLGQEPPSIPEHVQFMPPRSGLPALRNRCVGLAFGQSEV